MARYVRRRVGPHEFIDVVPLGGPDGATARVLDLGCGLGRHIVLAHELGLDAYGIDVSARAIEEKAPRVARRDLAAAARPCHGRRRPRASLSRMRTSASSSATACSTRCRSRSPRRPPARCTACSSPAGTSTATSSRRTLRPEPPKSTSQAPSRPGRCSPTSPRSGSPTWSDRCSRSSTRSTSERVASPRGGRHAAGISCCAGPRRVASGWAQSSPAAMGSLERSMSPSDLRNRHAPQSFASGAKMTLMPSALGR